MYQQTISLRFRCHTANEEKPKALDTVRDAAENQVSRNTKTSTMVNILT